jgi:hypothetical protein
MSQGIYSLAGEWIGARYELALRENIESQKPTKSEIISSLTLQICNQPCLPEKELENSLFSRNNIGSALHPQLDGTLFFPLM